MLRLLFSLESSGLTHFFERLLLWLRRKLAHEELVGRLQGASQCHPNAVISHIGNCTLGILYRVHDTSSSSGICGSGGCVIATGDRMAPWNLPGLNQSADINVGSHVIKVNANLVG